MDKSEKILVGGREFYINVSDLDDPNVKKLFLFNDSQLQDPVTNHAGMTRMVDKSKIEDVLKESAGGAGGAGYAVWGGGWGRTFGSPSQGGSTYGRGFGFGSRGGSSSGPNLMYTYSIKPLDAILQQPGTPQGDKRYIHVGSEIIGKEINSDEEVEGKIISIKNDEGGDILHYVVQNFDTGEKINVDPTSVTLINHEERPDAAMRDFVGTIGEEYYPSFTSFLNEDMDSLSRFIMESKRRG